jgi:hypothetical protein
MKLRPTLSLLALVCLCNPLGQPAWSAEPAAGAVAPAGFGAPRRADFGQQIPSAAARDVADWVLDSGDNHGLPFMIVDKVEARVFMFQADGVLRGAAPALLGMARGDDSAPGIGERSLASIGPADRTTPAGRFVAALDHNLHGAEMLWVSYETAISLHPVLTSNPQERRAQRLASATPADNRISWGCINVAADFFRNIVSPAFTGSDGIVYILPETRPQNTVFASYDVNKRAQRLALADSLPAPPAATDKTTLSQR